MAENDDLDYHNITLLPQHQPIKKLSTGWKSIFSTCSLTLCKTFLLENHWGVWVFWATHSPCIVPYNKCHTLLHCNMVPVNWFCCGPSNWTWIQFSNRRSIKLLLLSQRRLSQNATFYMIPIRWYFWKCKVIKIV